MTYAQLLNSHIYPCIGKRRVAEIGRETIHRLRTVVLPEQGASQGTVVNDLLAHATCTGAKQESLRLTHQEPHPIRLNNSNTSGKSSWYAAAARQGRRGLHRRWLHRQHQDAAVVVPGLGAYAVDTRSGRLQPRDEKGPPNRQRGPRGRECRRDAEGDGLAVVL